jgi:hypothetical protein
MCDYVIVARLRLTFEPHLSTLDSDLTLLVVVNQQPLPQLFASSLPSQQ